MPRSSPYINNFCKQTEVQQCGTASYLHIQRGHWKIISTHQKFSYRFNNCIMTITMRWLLIQQGMVNDKSMQKYLTQYFQDYLNKISLKKTMNNKQKGFPSCKN